MTLAQITTKNAEFWRRQRALMQRRLADRFICETAYGLVARELLSAEFGKLRSYEQHLEEAEKAKGEFKSELLREIGRKGGRPKSQNALVKFVHALVRSRSNITEAELRAYLDGYQGVPPIQFERDTSEGASNC